MTRFAGYVGLALGIITFLIPRMRRLSIVLLAALHYWSTFQHGLATSAADGWMWFTAIFLFLIPDQGNETKSYWVGVLRLLGFFVYFFAGLNKSVHGNWWTGEAMINAFLSPEIVKDPFPLLAQWPKVCQFLGWITLAQRLIVPWGFWSAKLRVRQWSAAILTSMHVMYMLSLNIGIFPWVAVMYLSQYFFPLPEGGFYSLPSRQKNWNAFFAGTFSLYLFLIPFSFFLSNFGVPRIFSWTPPGVYMEWNMFAVSELNVAVPILTFRTCSGRELTGDQIYWDHGTSADYFRRRSLRGRMVNELIQSAQLNQGTPGAFEGWLFGNFPDRISERKSEVFVPTKSGLQLVFSSGFQKVFPCAK